VAAVLSEVDFAVKLRTSHLRIPDDPRDGCLTVYLAVKIGKWTWYLSRWDTVRVTRSGKHVAWSWPGKVMCWYGGRF
jgi:hypothetical protein